ncbi:YcjX family protein [Escherichia coli]
MTGLLNGQRGEWSVKWRMMCEGLDPLAPADAKPAGKKSPPRGPIISTTVNSRGCTLFSQGALSCQDMQVRPRCNSSRGRMLISGESKLAQADKHTNAGMLRERFNYYCEKVVKGFYKNHFLRFDRHIVLVDCLQPLNSGPQAFNDMRLALTQLMQSFHYGQRTLFRRLFSPVIDKLLFAATKAGPCDHRSARQYGLIICNN